MISASSSRPSDTPATFPAILVPGDVAVAASNSLTDSVALPLVHKQSWPPVRTVIENGTVFPDEVTELWVAMGDVTNDGHPDLVITKGVPARAAVFQRSGDGWDIGTLLAGPSVYTARWPTIGAIRSDGQNWLVYSEHQGGNTNEWLRSHRYSGATLVESLTITERFAWKGWMAPAAGDLNGDGNVEVWFVSLHGDFPTPYHHLRRHEWDPATTSYPGVEIAAGEDYYEDPFRPRVGDFLGDGTMARIASFSTRISFRLLSLT
jgi:hypothetical protein